MQRRSTAKSLPKHKAPRRQPRRNMAKTSVAPRRAVAPITISRRRATVNRHFIDNAPPAIGPYCHATTVGDLVFVSGQLGLNAKHSNPDGVPTFEQQSYQALDNLTNIINGVGSDMKHIVKTTVLLTDMANFPIINKIYEEYFPKEHAPARVCYAVKQLPAGGLVEIEAIATLAPRNTTNDANSV